MQRHLVVVPEHNEVVQVLKVLMHHVATSEVDPTRNTMCVICDVQV